MGDGLSGPGATVAIVQARLGSRRLPRKVLADLCGTPLLLFLLRRLARAPRVDRVVVAIPDGDDDTDLAAAINSWGYEVYRGDANDVLGRYHGAAHATGAEIIVRITGDCPFVDPSLISDVVALLERQHHLAYAALGASFPDGLDCEAFRRGALDAAFSEATSRTDREHVTTYIRDRPDTFPAARIEREPSLGHLRMTIDEPADLELARAAVRRLGGDGMASFESYAAEVLRDGDLRRINADIIRNEGLWRTRNLDQLSELGVDHGRKMSDDWYERSKRVIPCATQTLSKGVDQFVRGVTPAFLASGSGCHVTDVDGNVFIDYPMALGPVILGHAYPRTVKAVADQVALGSTFTLPHPLEVEVAERIVDAVPCAEMVRFGKNGSDATTAAIRLARAVTGRDVVLDCGYHGWHDWHVVHTPRNAGIPPGIAKFVDSFGFNDIKSLQEALQRHDGNVACVILEVGVDDPEPGFLEAVKAETHRAGAVLVFDEIVTGFRFAIGGAQERYGVTPDLACLGKAIANGLPLSAVVGRRDLMESFDRVFFSGTFGGETLALAAAKATIDEIVAGGVIEHIWRQGERLRAGLAEAIAGNGLEIELLGQPPRSALAFRRQGVDWPSLRGLFLQETVRRGVLFGGPILTTYSHEDEDIERTLEVCAEALAVLRVAVESDSVDRRLDGPPPGTVFRPLRNTPSAAEATSADE